MDLMLRKFKYFKGKIQTMLLNDLQIRLIWAMMQWLNSAIKLDSKYLYFKKAIEIKYEWYINFYYYYLNIIVL